ncbi:MAG: uroporphyrinogen-III synthase [Pseudomonadota bacterium]
MTEFVVITRPLAQADVLAQRVTALGREAVIFPLLEILPLDDPTSLQDALRDLDQYALIAFVSPNAIDAAFAARADWPRHIPLAVVGEGSRAALASYGATEHNSTIISPTDLDRTDSQTLLAELDLDALRGKQVLIVRGETGRELLGDALRAAGAQVTPVAAYRRVAPAFDNARRSELKRLLACQNDWIVTSSEGLRFLTEMVAQLDETGSVAKMQQQRIIVSHVRIAETAQLLGFSNITLTRSGDDGLLAALQSCS